MTGVHDTARPARPLTAHPALPYVLPFAIFMVLLAVQDWMPLPQTVEFALRILVVAAVLWVFSRRVIDLGASNPIGSAAIGLAVFALWVAPDALFPGYRQHWLFRNALVG